MIRGDVLRLLHTSDYFTHQPPTTDDTLNGLRRGPPVCDAGYEASLLGSVTLVLRWGW